MSERDEELANLLFELSNVDRLRLLNLIKEEKGGKLSQLAQRSSATVQETSRHLERLAQSKLLERDSSGEYHLTSMGKLVLDLLPPFGFVVTNKEYFLDHDLSSLPREFVERLGELAESEYRPNVSDILRHLQNAISEATEYVWLMADQPLLPVRTMEQMAKRNVSWRVIVPSSVLQNVQGDPFPLNRESWQFRFVDDVRVSIAMNEKIAGLIFPDLKGKLNMGSGFRGRNPSIHSLCRDMFLYFWEGKGGRAKQPQDFSF